MSTSLSRRRAFSLVELMVVIAVVALLSGTTWMVVAPRLRTATETTETKIRLKQFALAINMYMTDHDGAPPPSLREVERPGLPNLDPRSGSGFAYVFGLATAYRGLDLPSAGFDPATNAVVKSTTNDWHGTTETTMVPVPGGGVRPYEVPILPFGATVHFLGARLDGSIGWFDIVEPWQTRLPSIVPPPPG